MQYGVRWQREKARSVWADDSFSPFCAFRRADGSTVVSDPFNARILIVGLDGEARAIGHQGQEPQWFPRWVSPLPGNRLLFADRNNRKVGLIEPDGRVEAGPVDLKVPLTIVPTKDGGCLVAGRGKAALMQLDDQFAVVRTFLDSSYNIHSASVLEDGRLLVCDIDRHQVFILNGAGQIEWSYGKAFHPGEGPGELSTPKHAWFDGDLVCVADGMNGRVLIVDLRGRVQWSYGEAAGETLWLPHCGQMLGGGSVLVTDACTGEVVEVDQGGKVVWRLGQPKVEGFDLWSPRVIDPVPDGGFLVADAYNHRVVRFDRNMRPTWNYSGRRGGGEAELFWPRSGRYVGPDLYIIADSRNGRLLQVDGNGRTLRELDSYSLDGQRRRSRDPHDFDMDENGDLLVVDSSLGLVLHVNWRGEARWAYGLNGELRDPHEARFTPDQGCLICDTGHSRVLEVSPDGAVVWELCRSSLGPLSAPRWCEPLPNGRYVIVDTGNNLIVCVDREGDALWSFGGRWGLDDRSLRSPRCARLAGNRLVSDSFNNRVVELALEGDQVEDHAGPAQLLHDHQSPRTGRQRAAGASISDQRPAAKGTPGRGI